MTDIPPPSFKQTFRWADGSEIGDFSYMTEIDAFEESTSDEWEPQAVLVETWERTAAEVRGWGGSVHSIPFRHERSTTALIGRIRSL